MIEKFLESWPLFHDVYSAGVLISLLLSLVGVAVVARDQIFLGAAVSQASLLGIAAGIWLEGYTAGTAWEWMGGDTAHSVLGGLFAVVGSLAISAAASRLRESREALTGWLYLMGASLSVLIVANSPHGMAEVNRLLSSTIIGADIDDVVEVGIFLALTVTVVAWKQRPLVLMLTDAETAQASGIAVSRWDHLLAVWLGLAVAWSIHVSGLIFTFGCLVLPGLVAKSLVREVRTLFVVAPLVALVASVAGFVVANDVDLPPGQVTVALLGVMQVTAWAVRSLRRR